MNKNKNIKKLKSKELEKPLLWSSNVGILQVWGRGQ
jgi:hypothetical protein